MIAFLPSEVEEFVFSGPVDLLQLPPHPEMICTSASTNIDADSTNNASRADCILCKLFRRCAFEMCLRVARTAAVEVVTTA